MPWASVVIPTYQRPELLRRAIASVIAQEMTDWELLVISDGHFPENLPVIESFNDSRIHYHELAEPISGNYVRNVGVKLSQGAWIAFLDDDDEWFPNKLSACRDFIDAEDFHGILAHQVIRRSTFADEPMPRRVPDPGEPYADYTFCRRRLVHGEGLLLTSAIMSPRDICLKTPWGSKRTALNECDWLCRTTFDHQTTWRVLMEPLAIWHFDNSRPRISNRNDRWSIYYSWARGNKHRMSRRAYAACLLTVVANEASKGRSYAALARIFREAVTQGSPRPLDLLIFMQIVCLPSHLRQRIRAKLLP